MLAALPAPARAAEAAAVVEPRQGGWAARLPAPGPRGVRLQPVRGGPALARLAAIAGGLTASAAAARRRLAGARQGARLGAGLGVRPGVCAGRGLWAAPRAGALRRGAAAQGTASAGRPEVVFVIGGPGSGKGTQCERIAKELGYVHLSAGELLREERKVDGSPLRDVIETAIREGGTVPSEVIADLLEKAMRKAGWDEARFVIDGYPRSEAQLRGWEATLSNKVHLSHCLSLEVTRGEMKRRLMGRAKKSGRLDDNEETIEKRFVTFEEETGPLLEHFGAQGVLRKVDGDKAPAEVWAAVRGLVQDPA